MIWQVGLYAAAVLIPLAAFAIEAIFIRQLKRYNAYLATGAIGLSCVLALIGFIDYTVESHCFAHAAEHGALQRNTGPSPSTRSPPSMSKRPSAKVITSLRSPGPPVSTGSFWVRPRLRPGLVVPLGIAIDNLSAVMFLMVTFIATLIHIYSMGYMHDDPRYPRFFTYLSLFCFSMLGLVASSNVFMIFMFWELVGVCSYLLIGFWYEEKVNSDAANKAFVVNRVGDVGMLMGLGLLWTSLGTFGFQEINQGFRGPTGELHRVTLMNGADVVQLKDPETNQVTLNIATGQPRQISFWMLTLAGLGIFAGARQKRAVSASRLATGCHGRTHAGVGADSCGDDGRGGSLPGRPVFPGIYQ